MKRPPLPKRLLVDGQPVTIVRRRLRRFVDGYAKAGEHTLGRITVATGLTRDGERATIVHELIHEFMRQADAQIAKKDEEYVLSQIDGRLVDALRENPELVRFLLAP